MEIGIGIIGLAILAVVSIHLSFEFCKDLTLALDEAAKEMAVGLVQGKALIDAFISGSKEDINCDIEEMASAVANSSIGNSASRLCDIINTTQNDIISSSVDKCWAPEVSGPSIEVFPAHNDEGIIITDIPVTEVPSTTILDTPMIVEKPNNVEVFPEQRVDVPIIIDFPAEKQNEKDNIIFIDGVGNPLKEVEFSTKQVGKKWGEHMKDYPNLKSYDEYKNFAQDVFNNPEKIFYDKFEGEYLYVRGEDLLRVKPDGSFVSIYPGADSAKVTKVIERGGELIWQQ
ncbi:MULTISPECIES: hypothetical protein [unclassified Clostridium]|uniref:hypothetical protein n=1 Tax=unclassified Clostridium TaxID=2614128 RepID=UPI002079A7EB|nr:MULTISPECIES: hypothetical protein [unclassified Clostridium]